MGFYLKQVWKILKKILRKSIGGTLTWKNLPWGTNGKNLRLFFSKIYVTKFSKKKLYYIKHISQNCFIKKNFFTNFFFRFFPLVPQGRFFRKGSPYWFSQNFLQNFSRIFFEKVPLGIEKSIMKEKSLKKLKIFFFKKFFFQIFSFGPPR